MDPDFLGNYRQSIAQRASQDLPPLALSDKEILQLIEQCKHPILEEKDFLKHLLLSQIMPGYHEGAYHKVKFLLAIAYGDLYSPLFSSREAVEVLGTMEGGYNIVALIQLLEHNELAKEACKQLGQSVLLFNAYYKVVEKYQAGNYWAKELLHQWAEAAWFNQKPPLPAHLSGVVVKVPGRVDAKALSPMEAAWNRVDIPLHAQSLLKNQHPEIVTYIKQLKNQKQLIFFVADELETIEVRANHRQAAVDALLWHIGEPTPFVPNRPQRGVIISHKIDRSTYEAAEHRGALVIQADTHSLQTGQHLDIYPYEGKIMPQRGSSIYFNLSSQQIDKWRMGSDLFLKLGHTLTRKARLCIGQDVSSRVSSLSSQKKTHRGYTQAQKIIGKACGVEGVFPGTKCEPSITVLDAQTVGTSLQAEVLKVLPYASFSVECVLQSFHHPSGVPPYLDYQSKLNDEINEIEKINAIRLKLGDGMIQPWLNRMLLPDEIGISTDKYTRFPIGINFSAPANQVAYAATTGVFPMRMPESVLVRFQGKLQPGITIYDLVHAIPYMAVREGLLETTQKKNIFEGRIIEIEGLSEFFAIEQSFELAAASPELGAVACVLCFHQEAINHYIKQNLHYLRWMLNKQYSGMQALNSRIKALEAWLEKGSLLKADKNAEYAATLNINLNEITEPLVASFNHPHDVHPLSAIEKEEILHDIFIGSAAMHIEHYRRVGNLLQPIKSPLAARLWIIPPTKLEMKQLGSEGYYACYSTVGARTEMPDDRLCMGVRLSDHTKVVANSLQHFSNRRASGVEGYLTSPEVATLSAILGRLPRKAEYEAAVNVLAKNSVDFYSHLSFQQRLVDRKII